MKKIYMSIALLYMATNDITPINAKEIGNIINAPIIAGVDGKFPAQLLIKFRERVGSLIEYNHSPSGSSIVKLHDLVVHEHTFDTIKAQAYLKKCITSLIGMAQEESFFSMFHVAYPIFDQIVEEWAIQFDKKNGKFYPFVKAWTQLGTEYDVLISQLHSLQEFEQYLCELHQFLGDFLVSCPKAYALYQSHL
jgi:hypothetical protein